MLRKIYHKTQNIVFFLLKGGLYQQVVRIFRSIKKTKGTKETLVEEEDHNKENGTNNQK